jgi:hypothetical protein
VTTKLQFQAIAAAFALLASGFAVAAPRDLEADFASHREHYRHVEGATDEPSCGGKWLGVYLNGSRIKKLDYSIETSRQLILREYYFAGSDLALVTETVYWLLDKNRYHAERPKLESKHHFSITDTPAPKKRELLDHADYLIHFYRHHANDFTRSKPDA